MCCTWCSSLIQYVSAASCSASACYMSDGLPCSVPSQYEGQQTSLSHDQKSCMAIRHTLSLAHLSNLPASSLGTAPPVIWMLPCHCTASAHAPRTLRIASHQGKPQQRRVQAAHADHGGRVGQ